jgi:hypothetical protein
VSDQAGQGGQGAIEVVGGFLRINERTWVKHSAILVIRSRPTDGGEAAEITVRPNSGGGAPPIWCDLSPQQIIEAISRAKKS